MVYLDKALYNKDPTTERYVVKDHCWKFSRKRSVDMFTVKETRSGGSGSSGGPQWYTGTCR